MASFDVKKTTRGNTEHHFIDYHILDSKQPKPARRLKVLTSRAEVSSLVEQGYLIIPRLLSGDSLKLTRKALDRVLGSELTNPHRPLEPCIGGYYLRHLLEKDDSFLTLFNLACPLSIARAVLGPQVQFDEISARVTDLGLEDPQIPWHIHHRVIPDPLPPLFAYPHGLNCLIYLDPVDASSGPLCVLPGSHKKRPRDMLDLDTGSKEGQVIVPVEAGAAVMIHANLWHRSLPGRKKTGTRRVIITGYLPSWLRTEEAAQFVPPPRQQRRLQNNPDPQVRELAGDFRWG